MSDRGWLQSQANAIEVTRTSPDGLRIETWHWWLNGQLELLMVRYRRAERRHREAPFKVVQSYYAGFKDEDDSDVPVPMAVKIEALEKVKALLTAKKWSEVRRGG